MSEIASVLDVPRNYLSKILHQMARAGVLDSGRGPRGGFRLAREASDVCVAELVEAVEPGSTTRRCLLGRPDCTDVDPCPLHDRWRDLAAGIDAFLQQTTLADLLERSSRMGGPA